VEDVLVYVEKVLVAVLRDDVCVPDLLE